MGPGDAKPGRGGRRPGRHAATGGGKRGPRSERGGDGSPGKARRKGGRTRLSGDAEDSQRRGQVAGEGAAPGGGKKGETRWGRSSKVANLRGVKGLFGLMERGTSGPARAGRVQAGRGDMAAGAGRGSRGLGRGSGGYERGPRRDRTPRENKE